MALNVNRVTSSSDPLETAPPQDRRTWWMTLFLLCGILGAMLALSVRTQQVVHSTVAVTSSDILQKQLDDQQRTIKAQQSQIAKYENGASSQTAETRALSADLKSAKFLAGLTRVQGPGVEVTLNDSKNPYPSGAGMPGLPAAAGPPPNIIHDGDIDQVVNELKAAGAEAVSVNDQRLVATSPIRCAGPTIFINNIAQTPPYSIKAIGEPKTLETALNLPGGISTLLKQFDPAMFSVQPAKHLVVPSYSGATPPRYAVPMADSSDKTAALSEKSAGA